MRFREGRDPNALGVGGGMDPGWVGLTLASSPSCSVRTPKRGMAARRGPCAAFLTPLICDIGRFLRSLSFSLGSAGSSTSCCLSARPRR